MNQKIPCRTFGPLSHALTKADLMSTALSGSFNHLSTEIDFACNYGSLHRITAENIATGAMAGNDPKLGRREALLTAN